MFAATKAMMGAAGLVVGFDHIVTQGTDSVPLGTGYGFMNAAVAGKLGTSAFGSVDDNDFNGETIAALFFNDAVLETFDVYLEGNLGSGVLTDMEPESMSGLSSIIYGGYDAGSDTTYWYATVSDPGDWDGSGDLGVNLT